VIHALLLLLMCGAASAAELFGKVVRVADGDTVTVLDQSSQQHRIRLSGIDAPERRQAYGDVATQHLSVLLADKPVRVVWEKRDRYGRIVGQVFSTVCDRSACRYEDAGLEQIRAGFAWHYKRYAREQSPAERTAYAAMEQYARERRTGLWHEVEPMPPWDFRSASISSRQNRPEDIR
jgi:endonuclease YncB( thermonuclease family)